MEALDGNSRQSGLMSIIHRDKIEHINTDRPSYGPSPTTMAGSAIVSPTSIYGNGPPPPYSSSSWDRTAPPHTTSGLISPPDSRRTSDNKNEPPPPIQTQQPHRQSLPSIHEALSSGPKANPYASPVSASIPPSHQIPYSQSQQPPSIPRSYPLSDHAQYPSQFAPAQARQPSPPQPVHPSANPFSRREPGPGTFAEISRHPSLSAIQTGPAPPNPFARGYEQQRYEQDPRALDRTPIGYSHPPPPPPQPAYTFGPPNNQPPPPTPTGGPTFNQPIYDARDNRDPRDEWRGKMYEKPVDNSSDFRQGVKRHLDVWDFENTLAQINVSSAAVQEWSKHYNNIAGEQPRLGNPNAIPDRMPTVESADDMLEHARKIVASLERMKDVIKTSDQIKEDQNLREQRGKGVGGYYDDDMSMYGDDLKSHGYGPEGKKRRGRAAPPGRCHSCNRAETPEWRRGPDGARTLCNACGLHYAKLTRKNTMKQSQSSNGSSLRPKSMDEVSPRLMSK